MKRFILFAFVFALGCHGKTCPSGQKLSNGHCCLLDHYYAKWFKGCRYCRCNEFGAKGGKKGGCDEKGDCYCYAGYTDGECGSCVAGLKKSNGRCCKLDHYYSTRYNQCRYCRCNEFGAKGGKKGGCDEKGDCYCYYDYTDGECGSCVKGATRLQNGRCDGGCPSGQKRSNGHCCLLDHYYSTRTNECRYCRCNEFGAKGGKKGECDEKGYCYCYAGYTDGACSSCVAGLKMSNGRCCKLDHYYATWNNKCRYCLCHEFGAKGGKKGGCDEKGQCYCYYDNTDGECASCEKGAKRLQNGRCDGGCPSGQKRSNGYCCRLDHYNYGRNKKNCRFCRCEEPGSKGGKKGECDQYGRCYCYRGYTGDECQKCTSDYKRSNGHCCKKDQYYYKGYGCLSCRCQQPGSKGGNDGECNSYGQCYCHPHFEGSECQRCKKGYQISNGRCCKNNQYSTVKTNICGAKKYWSPNYPIRDLEILVFKVTCPSKCTIRKIKMEGFTGHLQMDAFSSSGLFCHDHAKECPSKQLNENTFHIVLRPKPEFKGGKLIVHTRQRGVVTEFDADCAMTIGETGGHVPKYVRIKSGSVTIKFPKLPRLYEIQCNGNCRNIDFYSETNEKVILVAADDPVLVKEGGCYNCFCTSNRNQGYKQQCVKDGKRKFSLQKKSIFVTMVPDKEITEVRAFVKGDNIKSIKDYVRSPYGQLYDTNDGYHAVVHRLTTQTKLLAYCTGSAGCGDIKIEVFADTKVETIHAGKLSMNGNCIDCSCTDEASCLRRIKPKMFRGSLFYYFYVFIQVGKSQRNYPGYVKISGKRIRFIWIDEF